MIVFVYPWLLLTLPLPFLLRALSPEHREQTLAVCVPWFSRLARLAGGSPSRRAIPSQRSLLRTIAVAAVWSLVVLALMRPQWVGPPLHLIVPTRDMMLIVDLSGSMETEDFTAQDGSKVSRLTAVKDVVGDFLLRRQGDRVGLIVFGNAPFIQVPFTQDLDAARLLLEQTEPRMAGPKTALGDSIGLAIRMFEESEVSERVIIALTDGNDTGSRIEPLKAASIAADEGITIHTVAVGDPTAAGEEKLDEATLRQMAEVTRGKFFRASDREELAGIYAELDRIEPQELETQSHRPRRDLYHYALAAAFLCSLLALTRMPARKEAARD